jgi:hypothetical protein
LHTGTGTSPSSWRVYQFHHLGSFAPQKYKYFSSEKWVEENNLDDEAKSYLLLAIGFWLCIAVWMEDPETNSG